jgi:hypothetical protein
MLGVGKASALLPVAVPAHNAGPNLSGRMFNHLSLRSLADER